MKPLIQCALVSVAVGLLTGLGVAASADHSRWGAQEWAALASWVTAVIAVAAGALAWHQLRESRQLRKEQAQPYVVVFMESHAANPQFVDLVIANFGTTAAVDVRLETEAPLMRSRGDGNLTEPVWLPECIPLLAPGQRWHTLWDYSVDRVATDLPDRYTAGVTYRDARGESHSTLAVLDWGAYKGRRWVTNYTEHDSAKALKSIKSILAKWQEGIHGGLAVYVRDGHAKDEAERQAYEQWQSDHEELRERLLPGDKPDS